MSAYDLPALEAKVLELLHAHPRGIGEYELIKAMQAGAYRGFPQEPLSRPLALFRMHFLLFHVLHRLRERLWEERRAHLEIESPLRIVLQRYQAGRAGLAAHDPLREFYADLSRLDTTGEQDVLELLGKFWRRFHAAEHKQAALAVLELAEPVDYAAVKRRYRSLAMRHHPDRGGDKMRLQAINEAMAVLEKYYRP